MRYGFSVKLATTRCRRSARRGGEPADALAGMTHPSSRALSTRPHAPADGGRERHGPWSLVGAPPAPTELPSWLRVGAMFGPKVGVFVHATEPDTLPPDRRAQVEGRASQARMSLSRTGWEVVVLPPSRRLRDAWHVERTQPLVTSGS
jgi:hypothetical protein